MSKRKPVLPNVAAVLRAYSEVGEAVQAKADAERRAAEAVIRACRPAARAYGQARHIRREDVRHIVAALARLDSVTGKGSK